MENVIPYISQSGDIKLNVMLQDDNAWLTQKQLAELFGVHVMTINEHLKNIFETGELDGISVIRKFLITANDGKSYNTKHYNLDVLISLGFRVQSKKAIEFRKWAINIIKDFTTKGFVINDNLINNSPNHYENLLERVQSLRTSEKHVYEKLKECFKICSVDYDSNSQTAKDFFATIQNKFSYAITGKTAAEIILERADATKPNMGLQTWCESKIHKSDVTVAKNYLIEFELKQLQHLVLSFIEMASSFAYRRKDIKMNDWVKKLDNLINEFDYELLKDNGKVSSAKATTHAYSQYTLYKHSLNQLTT